MSDGWRLLADDGVGAAEGLAFDEALMAGYHRDAPPRPPTLRLYTYERAALVGRYQHLHAEVDTEACARTGTGVNRRPTGGGAIVMTAAQLGVAVVTRAPSAERPRDLLEQFSDGIVWGLAELGITASFRGKNDLECGGRKIAGLGVYLDGHGGLLFHASVLADLDVPFMLDVLRIPAAKLGDKAVAAVRERVTTVTAETGTSWTGAMLREVVAVGFAKAMSVDLEESAADARERTRADELVAARYGTVEWLGQRTPHPDATATAVFKTPAGLVRLYLALNGDTVKSVLFTGDFNEIPAPLVEFESMLKWKRLDPHVVAAVARRAMGDDPGLDVPTSVVVGAVLEAGERALARGGAAPVRGAGSCYFPEVG